MSQINPNINNQYFQQGYAQQQGNQQQVKIPNYYYVPENTHPSAKEILKENPAYDMVLKPFIEHPIATLGTWLGLGLGIDAYSKACSGSYEKSLVKKAANIGDKIENSKFIQSKPAQSVLNIFKSAGKKGSKIVQNSAILRAMKETPTMPEWEMVKTQMFNQKQEVVLDFIKITDALKLNSAEEPMLKNLGISNNEVNILKSNFGVQKISQIPEKEAVNYLLLNRLGKTPEEIAKIQNLGANSTEAVKSEILKEMGLTKEKLQLIKEDMYGKYIDDVKVATSKVKGKVKMGAGHYGWLGPLTKPFERTIGCDEIYNKLHSMSDGAKTATGRFTSKAMQMIHRGLTFGGDKLGALIFIAPVLVELAQNIKKADKDQKVGTAANGLVENISWVFTFPLALKIMHSIGGIKHAGMGKEKVEQVRKLKENFNKQVNTTIVENGIKVPNPDTFKTKQEYDIARREVEKQIKALEKVEGQNIFTKGLRKLAGIITPDLGLLKPYAGSNIAANTARKVPTFLKNIVGIPLRFGIWGLISMGVLGAGLTKITTSIFGKSYDAMKQDERNDELKKQKKFLKDDLNNRLYEAQRIKQFEAKQQEKTQYTPQQQMLVSRGITSASHITPQIEQPMLKKQNVEKESIIDNYTYIPSQKNVIPHPIKNNRVDNYTYIPSSECTIKSDKSNENTRKYIPSQKAADIQKTYDNSGLQSALDRAQKAEDKALRVLAGNFEGM